MQSAFDFFHHYQTNNGFNFNINANMQKEFDRLALYMSWKGKSFSRNKRKFLKKIQISNTTNNSNEEKNSYQKYFFHFQKFNGFQYNEHNEPATEFERLAKQMNWIEMNYLGNKKKFQEISDSKVLENKTENREGFTKTNERSDVTKKYEQEFTRLGVSSGKNQDNVKEIKKEEVLPNYFITYQKFHKFNYDNSTDPNEEFEKLAKFMNWKGIQYNGHENKFLKSLEEKNERIDLKPVQNNNEKKLKKSKKLKKRKKNKKSKTHENFFINFETHNKFDYKRDNNPRDEFERLAKFMNWKNKNYISHKKKFFNENEATLQDFFLQFQKFNGFQYNRDNEPRNEFERLVKKMNWDAVCYSSCERKFLQCLRRSSEKDEKIEKCIERSISEKKAKNVEEKLSINNYINNYGKTHGSEKNEVFEKSEENDENYNENSDDNNDENSEEDNEIHYEIDYNSHDCEYQKVNTDSDDGEDVDEEEEEEDNDEMNDYDIVNKEGDDYDMSDFDSSQAYFNYFKAKYNFKYNKRDNAFTIFEELANYLKWNRRHYYELKQFEKIKNIEEKIDYFMEFCAETDWVFDCKLSMEQNFEKLSDFLGWKEYRNKKTEFIDLVARLVEKNFQNLSQLQSIIKRYKLTDKIPNRFEECKIILEESLFVNIYDFVAGNKRKFPDLQSLRSDTIEKELYFPLREAKENLCYRILLRHIKN